MAGLAAHLPDPLVLLPPPARGRVGARDEELPPGGGPRVVRVELGDEPVGRAQQLAVDVDLPLGPGAVADADGPARAPPRQVRQRALAEVVLPADAEHDLQVATTQDLACGAGRQVVEELVGLVRAGGDPQGFEGEAGVPDPGVAVVPVAFAADLLGQRGRRGGDHRTGGLVGQRLQHPATVVDEIAPWPAVVLVQPGPRPPRVGRRAQRVVELLGRQRARPRFGRRAVLQPEQHTVARGERQPSGCGRTGDVERGGAGKHHDVGAAPGDHAALHHRDQRLHQPVLRPRRELHGHLDLATGALQRADEQAGRGGADRVRVVRAARGERVGDGRGARRRRPCRLEQHRLVDVAAGRLGVRVDGAHRPVPGPRVEEPAEQAGESKRGAHSQSTEPSRLTSAAVRRSDRRA